MSWRTRPSRTAMLLGVVAVVLMVASTFGASLTAFGPITSSAQGSGGSAPSSPSGGSSAAPAPSPAATAPPSLTVSPTAGFVGRTVTFNATAFAHAVTITISLPNGSAICSGTTSSKGAFSCNAVIPPRGGGIENFTAGDTKGNSAKAGFQVLPHLVPTPSSGLVGTVITFVGTGFSSKLLTNTTSVKKPPRVEVTWTSPGGATVACNNQTQIDGSGEVYNGTFSCSYTLPAAPQGSHEFLAKSVNSTLNGTGNFTVGPGLTVAPTHGPIGTPLTFAGTGFGANVGVNVNWTHNALVQTACSASTPNTGSFSCTYKIPSGTTGGAYNFTATDADKNVANASFQVTSLSVLPVSVPVNSTVTFSGAGFDADSTLNLSWEYGFLCVGTPTTDAGTYSCSFTVPDTPTGAYLFNASDGKGDYATTSLTIEPFLVLNPTYGENNTVTEFTGTGFAANSSLTVGWAPSGTQTTAFTTTTGTHGGFSYSFTVSVPRGGAYLFTATDSASHSASATFEVSLLSLSPAYGTNKTAVKVTASGFAPSNSSTKEQITISSSIGIDCNGTTTAQGNYTCSPSVGYAPGGVYVVTAEVGTDKALASFTIVPHVWASPSKQNVGSSVKFEPTGFAPSSLVTVAWASNHTTACSNTTTASGATNCTLAKLPPIPAGTYTFIATDTASHNASTTVTIVPLLRVSPAAGKSGVEVTFKGTGFAANASFNVTSTLGPACNGTAKKNGTASNGTFVCTYFIPHAPAGKYTFTATDSLGDSASTTFTLGASLTLSPTSGPVGTLISFSGTGFSPGKTANVTVNLTKTGAGVLACSATISDSGSFSCTYSMGQATPATYLFTARDWNYPKKPYGNNATANFTLRPSLTVTPSSGPVGTDVTFVGLGYAADVAISVTWSGGTACSSSTNLSGSFSCTYRIQPSPAGPDVFTAATSASVTANATFTIVSQLTISPDQVAVGTTVALNGTGFAPLTSVAISWSGGAACTASTSSAGSFVCSSYVVPPTPAGTYEFTAKVNGSAVAYANLTVLPALSDTPNSGPVGTKVLFRATGFGATVAITITWSVGTACSGSTAANGTFVCNYTIPAEPGAVYAFTANDGTHSASATFTLGTILSVTPALGPVGTTLHFSASGFAASATMTIAWSGGTICSGTTSGVGTYSCNETMPAAPLGSHTFTGTAGPSAVTTFTVRPALSVAPASGGDGTTAAFTGTGFPASTSVTVTWSGVTSCNASTSSSGGFSCSVTIPLGTAGGIYQFTATDAYSDTANATFQVVTGLLASPTHGPDLTQVTFTGTNFAASSSVSVTSSLGTTACSTTTNATGGFTCTYQIPASTPGGTYNFTATDSKSHTASVLFVVTYLTAAPTGVEIGTSVSLSGGGFNPSSPFTVTDPWGTACGSSTAATGTFSCKVTIPASATPGEYNFSASDGTDVAVAGFGVFTIAAPTASVASADVGQSVSFTVSASGGSVLTYSWTVPAALNCAASTTSKITCVPNAAVVNGSVSVKVTDFDQYFVTSPSALFTVYIDPTQSPASASLSSADLGQNVTFTAVVHGGLGPGNYAWSASGLNCTASTGPTMKCRPVTAGSFTVAYAWTDANGMAATGSTTLTYTVNELPKQAPPTPSQASADVGQKVTFAASVSYGSGGGTYAWTASSGLNCTTTTTSTLTCVPSAAGTTYSVSYVWTDSNGIVATGSTSLSYTVYVDPTVGKPAASVASADVGQSVNFTVTASGGSGGLTYSWTVPAALNCAASTTSKITCVPNAAVVNGSVSVKVTDSDLFSVTSVSILYTVYIDPTVGKPTASVASADVGQSVNFTVTASGGSGGLTYSWTVPAALNCAASTTSKITCKPNAAVVNGSVTVKVTDSDLFSVTSAALLYTVYADPTQSPAIPSQASADIGQTISFKASVSLGSGGGTYAWSATGLNCTTTTGPKLTCTPSQAGTTFTVSYVWTDSNGVAATGSTSEGYTVYSNPTVSVPTPNHASADIGQSITFTTTPSGGSDGFTYTWTAPAGLGCTVGTTDQIICVPTTQGVYTVTVFATDPNGVKSPTVTSGAFQVYVDPSVTTPTPSRATTDVDEPVTFTTVASGGAGTLTYTWSTPSLLGCTTDNSPAIMCTPGHTGTTFTVSVYVTDSNGFISPTMVSANFTVYAAPALTVPSPSHTSSDVGESVTFTTTPSGGTGVYTYTWTASAGLGCVVQNASQISCVPTAKGNFTVTVSAIDTNHASTGTESLTPYTVYLAPAVTSPLPNHGSTDVGNTITFATTATGGSGSLAYTWTMLPGLGCTVKSASSITCIPTAAGTYTVNVTVTDSNGVTSAVGSRTGYLVYTKPTATLQVKPSSILQGKSVTFTATAAGGTGSYTYAWTNLPAGCAVPKTLTLTCTPSGTGSFLVTFTATDSNNASGAVNTTLTVQASFLGLPANEGYAIVVVGVIAGIVALTVGLVILVRKRRSKRQQMQF